MKRSVKGKQRSPLLSVCLGAVICACILGGVCLVGAAVCMTVSAPLGVVGPASLVCLLASGVIAGLLLPRITSGKLLYSALSALTFVLIAMVVGTAIGKGHLPIRCPVNYACYMGVSTLCSYLATRQRGHRRRR